MSINKLITFIKDTFESSDPIPLHAPLFSGNEQLYVGETITSSYVSSVGRFVSQFEKDIEQYTDTKKAVSTVNGTAALNAALYMAGVQRGDIVITQALTFVATCNAIFHMGADPLFIDVSKVSMGLCPSSLRTYLEENAYLNNDGSCAHKTTKQLIRAVVPMHTFGHPVEMDELMNVCNAWKLTVVEDAAESLGSFYKSKHSGTIGRYGITSFNGNKIITTGGGGMVFCSNSRDGNRLKHITTTAKVSHQYEYFHDEPGFNYRMPNLNAALGCAQLEVLSEYLKFKRNLAMRYLEFFKSSEIDFFTEPEYATSNYWLNTIICPDKSFRDKLLIETNNNNVMTRPIWTLMNKLPAFKDCLKGPLDNSEWFESRVVNIPSSVTKINF